MLNPPRGLPNNRLNDRQPSSDKYKIQSLGLRSLWRNMVVVLDKEKESSQEPIKSSKKNKRPTLLCGFIDGDMIIFYLQGGGIHGELR
jgi:hypothetical protein